MQHLVTQGRTGFTHSDRVRLRKVWHCSEMVLSRSRRGVKAAGTFFSPVKGFPCTTLVSREQNSIYAEIILCEELVTKILVRVL